MDLALTLRNLLARTRGYLRRMSPPLEKLDFFLPFFFFFFFNWNRAIWRILLGANSMNRPIEQAMGKIFVRCILGEYSLLKYCPNLNCFVPESIDLDRKFLKISQNTFKINQKNKKVRILL